MVEGALIGAADIHARTPAHRLKPFQDLAHGSLGGAVNKGALFVVAVAALAVCVAMLRRLPVAYGAYGLASLAPSLSTPHDAGPLNGSIRYVAVVFPIFLAVALWLEGRPRLTLALGTVSALALAYCSVRFGSWRWVA